MNTVAIALRTRDKTIRGDRADDRAGVCRPWKGKVFSMHRSRNLFDSGSTPNATLPFSIRDQLTLLLRMSYRVYLPAALLLFAALWVGLKNNVSTFQLTKDLASITGVPFYYGLVAQLGVLVWCVTAAICLFSASVTQRFGSNDRYRSFLLFAGAWTLLLLFDDLLRLQDHVFPQYLHLPGGIVSIVHALFAIVYVVRFRSLIGATDWGLLLGAGVFFAGSLVIDIVPFYFKGHLLLEDTFKLLGILSWCAYYVHVSRKLLSTAQVVTIS